VTPRLGIRPNLGQFTVLIAINALVGGMIGQERTVLPLLAEDAFDLTGYTVALTFIVAFGMVKAVTNLAAGTLADRYGRKPVLVAGWLIGIPIPLILIWAPGWEWVITANVLLGVNQGLTWSTTVIMKIDLAGPRQRGLAVGLNEAAGYIALSLTALATGYIAATFGLRPEPFYLGIAYAGLGLGLSALAVRETRGHVSHEAAVSNHPVPAMSMARVFAETTLRNPSLSAVSQAGLVNNLNDGMAWGLLPIYYATAGLSFSQIGILAAIYPGVWGIGQLLTGSWSDRIGRKKLIVAGLFVQTTGIALIALTTTFSSWVTAAVILGAGTALVYPTLLAAVGDEAHPAWRATSLGVYRFWRDAGFAVGAIVTGIVADLINPRGAIWLVAGITALSAVVVAKRMAEGAG
jgi:MFS family permease